MSKSTKFKKCPCCGRKLSGDNMVGYAHTEEQRKKKECAYVWRWGSTSTGL